MKSSLLFTLSLATWLGGTVAALAQGTAFTYQGRLDDGGSPASGLYDFRCQLYDAPDAGALVSATITNAAVLVTNGLFVLDLDFGSAVFNGPPRWLLITLRANNGPNFQALLPRQKLAPTPYAITAGNLNGTLPGGSLVGAYGNAVTFNNSANQFNGAFTGNGGGLTDVNAAAVGGLSASSFWKVGGNAGTTPGVQFLGTTDNQPLELRANGQRALRLEPTGSNSVNTVGGSSVNWVPPGVVGATIGGGGAGNYSGSAYTNRATANMATVSGGMGNAAEANYTVVGGGVGNTASGSAAVVAGGWNNTVRGDSASVGGGTINQARAFAATIGGGEFNQVGADDATIGGGNANLIETNAVRATISGGALNRIDKSGAGTTIGGGVNNQVSSNVQYSVIAGGADNLLGIGSGSATIAGGRGNAITNQGYSASIGGGLANRVGMDGGTIGGGQFNVVLGPGGFIGGGIENGIWQDVDEASIGGGLRNNVSSNASYASIAGGEANSVGIDSAWVAIGGGRSNLIDRLAPYASISGGRDNRIGESAEEATIAGGHGNAIGVNAWQSFVGGGAGNVIGDQVGGSVVSGGANNTIDTGATFCAVGGGGQNQIGNSTYAAIIGGGSENRVAGAYASVPGGRLNTATGDYALAAGRRAKAYTTGAFVWADSQDADFASTGANQFAVRANGGVFLQGGGGSATPQMTLLQTANDYCRLRLGSAGFPSWDIAVQPSATPDLRFWNGTANVAWLTYNGDFYARSHNLTSDRNAKEHFTPVDPREVLEKVAALPITRWNFKGDAATAHLGPVAQDFHAAFGVGPDDQHIATVDADGVALAAIQGLNQKLEAELKRRDSENAELKQLNESLEKRLEKLEKLLVHLEFN